MIDTSRDPKLLHPPLWVRWEHMQREWEKRHPELPKPFLSCTYRGPLDQADHFAKGKSKAVFGRSLHNFKPAYAFDIAFAMPGAEDADWSFHLFEKMAEIAEPLGLEWGGRWARLVDGPHFQMPMTWEQAKAGVIPDLPPLQRAGGWLLVTIGLDGEESVTPLGETPNVVTRYDAARKRVYVRAEATGEAGPRRDDA